LRTSGATDLERRLLEAAAGEQPSPEMSERIAQAIGVSAAAAVGAGVAATKLEAGAATSKAAAGSSSLLLWISAGIVSATVVGSVVAARAYGTVTSAGPTDGRVRTQTPTSPGASASVAAAPTAAPVEVAPGPIAESPVASPEITVELPPSVAGQSHAQSARAAPRANDIGDQIALVDAARASLAAGAPDRALELLRQYQTKYPAGSFRPEAAALRIEALAALGRTAEARSLAERFVAEHRGSPLADRVARVVGLGAPP
jgi:hypothetical protein